MPDIEYTLPPYTVDAVYLPSEAAGLIPPAAKAVGIEEAWKTSTGKGVSVAVLDTGCDRQHAEHGDLQGVTLLDATGHGPYDAAQDGHGTHCLGIVGATGKSVYGFAPGASLISVRCMRDGVGSSRWIERALDIAREQKADIISMSLGSPQPNPAIARGISRATAAGCIVVAAAGNSGKPNSVNFPARFSRSVLNPHLDTLAVGAVDNQGRPAPFSSFGPEVDVAAPGVDMISTFVNGGYARLSGTSMATPAVAGVLALCLSSPRRAEWQASLLKKDQTLWAKEVLVATATDTPDPDGSADWRMIRADRALIPTDPPEPPADSPETGWKTQFNLGPFSVTLHLAWRV